MPDLDPATPDSPPRTTPPEPTGSSPEPRLGDFTTAPFDCPTHGRHDTRVVRLSTGWADPECQQCRLDRERKEEHDQSQLWSKQARERQAEQARARLSRVAIPPRFETRTFDNYLAADPGCRRALDTCRSYAETFPDHLTTGASVILCGNAGTGKTHLACAIARHVIAAHHRSAAYMTVGKAFRTVKDTYRKDAARTEEEALAFFAAPDLLVLDEIGVQYGTDAEKNILFEVVNERYEALKPTVLISNLALPALTEYAGERVIDRMKENGGRLVTFGWKSHRGAA